jgi:hypothetical protein
VTDDATPIEKYIINVSLRLQACPFCKRYPRVDYMTRDGKAFASIECVSRDCFISKFGSALGYPIAMFEEVVDRWNDRSRRRTPKPVTERDKAQAAIDSLRKTIRDADRCLERAGIPRRKRTS